MLKTFFYISLLFLLLIPSLLRAEQKTVNSEDSEKGEVQSKWDRIKEKSARVFFGVGVQYLNTDAFNSRVTAVGHPAQPKSFLTFGGGGHVILNRFIIGGEGHGILGKTGSITNFNTRLNGGYGLINFGYVVLRFRGLDIFPLFGLGGGGFIYEINPTNSVSFNDVLSSPQRGSSLVKTCIMAQIAIGMDYLLKFSDKARTGMLLGMRMGYLFELKDFNWSLYNNQLAGDSPKLAFQGFFFRLVIGGGGN